MSFVSASDNNDTVLSVSESDNMLSISSNNISYHSGNDDVIGNSIESDDVLSDGEIATKLHVTPSKEGIIEDDSVVLNITLTDENDNPIEKGNLKYYINNVVDGNLDINNGTAQYTLKRTSGFYYFYCDYTGIGQYASSQSNKIEVIFANDNTMTDLAVRMILADGELDLTKDFSGYGSNKVIRRNVDDYSQVLVQYEKLNEGIPVSGSFTINGNGHKIDASGSYQSRCFFIVDGGTFTLNDLIFSNGYNILSSNHLFSYKNSPTINFNNVTLKDSYSSSTFFGLAQWAQSYSLILNVKNSMFLNNEIYHSGNSYYSLFCQDLSHSNIQHSVFINNTDVFHVNNWYDVNIRNNLFIDNDRIFTTEIRFPMWEQGTVSGNYFGTNDTSYINNNILPKIEDDIYYTRGTHTYLSIDGNRTFSEDDVQDYDIYFTGNVPAYETVISYTSNHSTIDTTAINISSTKTTVRVSPKGYGLETLVIEPNLYEMPINITKSTKVNYNVEVDAPETQYSIPLVITVNVKDEDNNTVTTTANVTINGTTETININDGVGTLTVNDLIPGKYDITTKIISNMNNYRNTTIYSSTNITNANAIITLSLNTTESIAREKVAFTIKTQNVIGNDISTTVYLLEDGIEVGSTDTDSNGNAIYYYAPEAGNHTYTVMTHDEGYWKSAESNQVDLYVTTKKPTKLTISSDIDMITDPNQKATITSRLTDEDNNPLSGVDVNLVANDIVVDTKTTDDKGECEFEFTSTSNLYHLKTVYNGNLTYYDNSSDVLDIIVSTGGAFFDLSILINATEENGVLTLVRNFTFDENLDQDFVNGIPIDKNITVKGNGNTIDALSKARIFNITAENVALDSLNIINGQSANGGAILLNDGILTITNSNFTNNTVIISKESTKDMDNIDYNGGGAIYAYGELIVDNSSFKDNGIIFYNDVLDKYIYYFGGGVIYARNNLNISNSFFDSNRIKYIKNVESSYTSTLAGSSVYAAGNNLIIDNSTFKNGYTKGYSTVSYVSSNGNATINNSSFYNNTAGRSAALSLTCADASISNSNFENNTGDYGIFYISTKSLTINDSRFINNTALHESLFSIGMSQKFNLEKSILINNYGNDASIIYFESGIAVNFMHNVFVNNTASSNYVISRYDPDMDNKDNFKYNYWGNNTPFDAGIFNQIKTDFDYITIEIVGDNVTYTTIPTTYLIRFNGMQKDQLPNFETLIDALAQFNVNLDKSSIVINGTGASVVLTSDEVQNITLVVGPEYNILAYFNITVKQLIKKNYTSNITFSGDTYGDTLIATIDIFDVNGNQTGINGPLTYTFNGKTENTTVENGKVIIPLGRNDAGEYNITFVYNSTDLFYNNLDGNKTFNISKANITFTLDVNNATYGEDVNITATPQRGVNGNFTFYIENELNQTVRISAGKAIYTLSDLAAGNYTLIATYNGNNNYNALTVSRNFTVSKASSKVEISIDDVNYGDEIIAFVTGENIIGNVTITVNNKTYSVEIRNNSGNVTIDRLNAGKYNASVVYDGNSNITGSSNATQFEVFKASSNMTVDIGESILGHNTTVTVKFSEGVEGTVTVTVDGKDHELPIKDGIATLNLTDLAEGNHTVSVKYPGSENYNSSEFNSTFSTKSLTSQINVTSSDITYGEDLIVRATVNADATGNVEFSINNVTKTAAIKDGVAEVSFEGLDARIYNITAKYLGDSTYISSTNTTSAKVSKANSTVLIIIGEIKEGENILITITVLGNASGNVTLEIAGFNPQTKNLNNGSALFAVPPVSGNYTVKVSYGGDDNYLASSNSTSFLAKYEPSLNIEISDAFVGDDYTIDVVLNDTATGSVLITVDGVEYNKTLVDGKASVTLKNLTEGVHTVEVVYSGDDNFYNATGSKSFVPKSISSGINVTAKDIVYGNDLIVKAVVTEGATGNVEFTVNGVTKTVQIKNGAAEATFDKVDAGDYVVTAKYLGDHEHTAATNITSVKVSKAKSFVLIDVSEIREGETVTIKFTAPGDATGTITVEIPGLYTPRNRTLTGGVNTWVLTSLKSGNYTLNVVYNGDKNYLSSSNSTVLVSKYHPSLDIKVSDAFVGEDCTIDVVLNNTATGTVFITVDGVEYNKTLSKGKASVTLKNLAEGNHTVEVAYSGDDYFYNATGSKSFAPKSILSSINVTAENIVYGSELVVKASVTEGATGNVEFTVNGVTKSSVIKNGIAQTTFTNLDAGNYKVTAKYLGDREYSASSNTTRVKVSKAKSQVSIDVGEIKDGENVVIKFNVSSDATGTITVEIPGLYSSRNRTLTNGANTWTISPLKHGTYTLNVIYNGDKNYLASSNSAVLIAKAYPVINIEVSESVVGKDAVINVELPENATGSVLITVDGVKYNRTLENGKASIILSNVTKGTHKVDVLYSGDKYYYSSTNSTSFDPKQLDSHLYLLASDVEFGQDLVVRAVVDSDATGTVTFTVNGITQAVQVHQGFAAATYSNLNASAYDIKATYSGNEVYSSSSNTTRANVLKANSTVQIKVGEIKEGQNVRITITVSKSATGNITVEIPGLYYQRVRQLSNNQNIWVIAPLDAGLYEVKVAYLGDNNYYGSSNSTFIDYNRVRTTLNVDAIPTKNNVRLVANLTAEDGQLITAWVYVNVNGTEYRIPVFNGTGYLDLGKLEGGDYKFEALYKGTRAIINSTDEGSFTVVPVIPILNIPDVIKYHGGSERLYVYLKDNYNDPIVNASVVITINGQDYERKTNENGTTSIALNLNSGEFETVVIAKEYNLTSNAKVTVLPTVNGTDVVKVYRNATQYYATFRGSDGNYLKEGTMVKFNINGVFYERKISGDEGMAKLNLNLEQGNYILTAMNPVTGENAVNNITVISRIIENNDVTKYFRNGTQYTVKLLGDDGKPVGAGETITFNINGVMYTRTTNASGIAKLNINLNPGTYIITGEYAGCRVSNTIKVLPILTAKDLAKKYGTSNPFVAKLVDGQGNPYAGQTITFNINGVFYNRVTDNAGQAKLNINLQAGQYIITSSYNGASLSNKVTITP